MNINTFGIELCILCSHYDKQKILKFNLLGPTQCPKSKILRVNAWYKNRSSHESSQVRVGFELSEMSISGMLEGGRVRGGERGKFSLYIIFSFFGFLAKKIIQVYVF